MLRFFRFNQLNPLRGTGSLLHCQVLLEWIGRWKATAHDSTLGKFAQTPFFSTTFLISFHLFSLAEQGARMIPILGAIS